MNMLNSTNIDIMFFLWTIKRGHHVHALNIDNVSFFFSLKSEESIKKQIETCISAASATTIKN